MELDESARPYNPHAAPTPGWDRLANGVNWAGLLLLLGVIYGAPVVLILWLIH